VCVCIFVHERVCVCLGSYTPNLVAHVCVMLIWGGTYKTRRALLQVSHTHTHSRTHSHIHTHTRIHAYTHTGGPTAGWLSHHPAGVPPHFLQQQQQQQPEEDKVWFRGSVCWCVCVLCSCLCCAHVCVVLMCEYVLCLCMCVLV